MNEKNLKIFPPSAKNIHWYGRNGKTGNATALFWTASGFLVNTTAGELWAELEADYGEQAIWVGVWVDGDLLSRFVLERTKRWYLLCSLMPGIKRNIELLKETQAMAGDEKHSLLVHALGVPADFSAEPFLSPAPFRANIEFVGDSITTGEGLCGAKSEADWNSSWISLRGSYALLTARALNADFRFLSQSGWGVFSGWDNDRTCTLPPHYDSVCSVLNENLNENCGAHLPNDFSAWKSDFVVVNLGTNDANAFHSPAKTASDGTVWKMHLDENGNPCKSDVALFLHAVTDFVAKIRTRNPQAQIIWAYGMCTHDFGDEIEKCLEDFAQKTGDTAISFVRLPAVSDSSDCDAVGSLNHPGRATHKAASQALLAHIFNLMK